MAKEDTVLQVLNEVLAQSEPLFYDKFNYQIKLKENGNIDKLNIIVGDEGCPTTISLITSIFSILTEDFDNRLCVQVNDDGIIEKFSIINYTKYFGRDNGKD